MSGPDILAPSIGTRPTGNSLRSLQFEMPVRTRGMAQREESLTARRYASSRAGPSSSRGAIGASSGRQQGRVSARQSSRQAESRRRQETVNRPGGDESDDNEIQHFVGILIIRNANPSMITQRRSHSLAIRIILHAELESLKKPPRANKGSFVQFLMSINSIEACCYREAHRGGPTGRSGATS